MIEDILTIAAEAGEIVREGFGKNIGVEYKTNESNLVTEIDKKSEKVIVEFIQKKYPAHGILAEEGSQVETNSDYLWVIDPLDGTTNFTHGLPIFSISIGLQKKGETVAGVVYDIMQNIFYKAELGSGSFANSKRISVNKNDKLLHALLVTGFPYDIAENPGHAFEIFNEFLKSARGIRRLGSAAIDFCYLAKGVFDGFWEVHLHPWDICAGKLIAEEAGGKVTGFDDKEINIFAKKILASNSLLHQSMIETIKRAYQ